MTDASRLYELYRRLRDHFGYAADWWPGTPVDIFLTSVLVQQCDWATAWEALGRLHSAGLATPGDLGAADVEALEELIRPVAFYKTKATRLRALCAHITRRHGTLEALLSADRPTAAVRSELLSLPGIGNETADAILNFAGQHPRFVVDAYTRRTFARVGGFGGEADWWLRAPYGELHELFVGAIRERLPEYRALGLNPTAPPLVAALRDMHAQLTELGKHHCTKSAPRCRSRGVSGWRGYFHCANHCGEECRACPAACLCAVGSVG